jgi:hypothetical protein
LREHLDELKAQITSSSGLGEKEKFDVVVDIESVKDQLAKESPDRNILGQLWQNIDRVAKLAGMVEAVHKVWPLIKPLL